MISGWLKRFLCIGEVNVFVFLNFLEGFRDVFFGVWGLVVFFLVWEGV